VKFIQGLLGIFKERQKLNECSRVFNKFFYYVWLLMMKFEGLRSYLNEFEIYDYVWCMIMTKVFNLNDYLKILKINKIPKIQLKTAKTHQPVTPISRMSTKTYFLTHFTSVCCCFWLMIMTLQELQVEMAQFYFTLFFSRRNSL
jgi:hypothetical protein